MGATAAYGAQLQMGDGETVEAFTTISGVRDISGPEITRDLFETTSHDAADGFETFVRTIKRSGNVTFAINWDPRDGTHDMVTGLGAQVQSDDEDPINFRLVYARIGHVWEFSAYVTGFSTSAPVAGIHNADVTMKIIGAPELVEGS